MRLPALVVTLSLFAFGAAQAGPLRDRVEARIEARHAQQQAGAQSAELAERLPDSRRSAASIPAGVSVTRDVAYGLHAAQRIDIYTRQTGTRDAPLIVMVHGGGWSDGDKAMAAVVENKVARWVPRGFVFVSVNYRLLPAADPLTQAGDVARALAFVQTNAARWGGNGEQVILMGHSAGAHLVSLITASPTLATARGVRPWLGTVALDSAAFDVTAIMRAPHLSLYDDAFGSDPAYWRAASPLAQLAGPTPPMQAVCSSRRATSCEQAGAYASKATGLGDIVRLQPEDLSHSEINERLGLPGAYTDAVESFMRTLSLRVAFLLR